MGTWCFRAKLKLTTNDNLKRLDEVSKEENELQQKHGEKRKELADLQLGINNSHS